ncbi:MAG: hypothetical protein PHP06_00055 [Clostridia bacterium]|nr:hypothetical protein [Clostridia bacterium]
MDVGIKKSIVAVVTTHPDKVGAGGVPCFYAKDEEEMEKIAMYLTRITYGMVHDLENGVYIIVKH